MTEQIYEVTLIVRTNGATRRTETEIQDALHEALKWLEREDVRKITATQVYEQTR
jgi:hypothetical protein